MTEIYKIVILESEQQNIYELAKIHLAQELNTLEREIIYLKLKTNPKSSTFEVNPTKRELVKLRIPFLEQQKVELEELHKEYLTKLAKELKERRITSLAQYEELEVRRLKIEAD